MLIISNIGDQVWLITSRQTDPDLGTQVSIVSGVLLLPLSSLQLVDIWVKDAVDEADARGFVWILVREFDVDLPDTTLKGGCKLAVSKHSLENREKPRLRHVLLSAGPLNLT
jgi:hypothetical protein